MNKQPKEVSQIFGNFEDKYHSRNVIEKYLVNTFIKYFETILNSIQPLTITRICEVGCGEGELLKIINNLFPSSEIQATDISKEVIEKAKRNCSNMPIVFSVQNAERLSAYSDSSFDLVICSEVLEHLSNPQKGLDEIFRISKKYVLISVPNEPIWRILNILRGKYIQSFGNTPGHLNHWNSIQFVKFLKSSPDFSLTTKKYPFPWQMVLLKRNDE